MFVQSVHQPKNKLLRLLTTLKRYWTFFLGSRKDCKQYSGQWEGLFVGGLGNVYRLRGMQFAMFMEGRSEALSDAEPCRMLFSRTRRNGPDRGYGDTHCETWPGISIFRLNGGPLFKTCSSSRGNSVEDYRPTKFLERVKAVRVSLAIKNSERVRQSGVALSGNYAISCKQHHRSPTKHCYHRVIPRR